MKKLKKVVAMLLVGALVLGNVGAIPVSAEETTTSGVVYKEDFNNAQKPTLADYKITTGGTIVSGGTGEAYGKMTDENGNGCIYLRGHGASGSGTTNTIIIPFDDTAYTNEIVWAEFDIKYMATGRPYQLTITPDSNAAVATIKTTDTTLRSWIGADYQRISIKVNFGENTYEIYLNGALTTVSGQYTVDTLKQLKLQLAGNGADKVAEGGNKGICIDNVAVYVSDEQLDLFPTGITLDKNEVSLTQGATEQLTATVTPAGVEADVTWTSSNNDVATVANGLVTAVAEGEATITATTGVFSASCVVTVTKAGETLLYKEDFSGAFDATGHALVGAEVKDGCMEIAAHATSTEGSTAFRFPFANTYTEGVMWVEMDVKSSGDELPYFINVRANETTSATPVHVANMTKLFISNNNEQTGTKLNATTWTRLSYKIDLTNNKYYAYADGTYLYEDDYTNVTCQSIGIHLTYKSANGTGNYLRVDNIAVYMNEVQIDMFAPEIKGTTISLNGNIGINYYMDLRGIIGSKRNDASMKFTLPNGSEETIKVSNIEWDSATGYYVFPCEVAAKEMRSTITAQMVDSEGKELMAAKEYNVYNNANYIIQNAELPAYEKAAPLAKALLNYGAYAQINFNYNTENLANEGNKEDFATFDDTLLNTYKITENDSDQNVGFAGSSLNLDSETALDFYFRLNDVDVENVTFRYGNTVLEPIPNTEGYYVVRINDISAKNLDKEYAITVEYGGTSFEVKYSAMAYAYNVLNNVGGTYEDALKNVVRALYNYNQAANDYFEVSAN